MTTSWTWKLLRIGAYWAIVALLTDVTFVDSHFRALVTVWTWPTVGNAFTKKIVVIGSGRAKCDCRSSFTISTSWARIFSIVSSSFWTVEASRTVDTSISFSCSTLPNASFTSWAFSLLTCCTIGSPWTTKVPGCLITGLFRTKIAISTI